MALQGGSIFNNQSHFFLAQNVLAENIQTVLMKITVEASGDSVRVINNIIPKITSSPSTGLGHKYISRQYLDLCGKSIDIDIDENTYCVTLPLL